ncbi:MAG TPA: rhomboid family intramembrane serine protease [Solirubrobacteraceae bacterium]|nr:rhomboid family intramembrane serine protease [Solirubrobacteraceae bacterium]
MSSGADLFVVCKQCGSEVSPYITECPYCGNRLRRRAPKLPRPGEQGPAAKPARRSVGSLLGRGSRTAGSRRAAPAARPVRERSDRWAATRPYASIALVAVSCGAWIATYAEPLWLLKLIVVLPVGGEWWKPFTAQFGYFGDGGGGVYAFVAVLAVGLFGWLVERRHGPIVVLALFFAAGVGGALAAEAAYPVPFVAGANAGALALLACWAAPDLQDLRAGRHYEGDLLGAGAFAALLLAIPFVRPEASWLAGVVGAAIGLLVGLGLGRPGRSAA